MASAGFSGWDSFIELILPVFTFSSIIFLISSEKVYRNIQAK